MEIFRKHPPSIVFHGATLIGCVALLLGVAGIFYFGGRERTLRDTLPADACTVIVRGLDSQDGVGVEATWKYGDGSTGSEFGRPGAERGTWYFREAPEGQPLTLRVFRGEARRVLHEQHAIFTRGAGFQIWVREP